MPVASPFGKLQFLQKFANTPVDIVRVESERDGSRAILEQMQKRLEAALVKCTEWKRRVEDERERTERIRAEHGAREDALQATLNQLGQGRSSEKPLLGDH